MTTRIDTQAAPARIQRSRANGWRMPTGAIYVGRPTVWGNPVHWEPSTVTYGFDNDGNDVEVRRTRAEAVLEARRIAVNGFREMLANPVSRAINGYPPDTDIRAALNGHDLACWCPLTHPCHADVLLDIANRPAHDDGGLW